MKYGIVSIICMQHLELKQHTSIPFRHFVCWQIRISTFVWLKLQCTDLRHVKPWFSCFKKLYLILNLGRWWYNSTFW